MQDTYSTIHGRIFDEFGRLEQQRSTQLTSVPAGSGVLGSAGILFGATAHAPAFTNFLLVLGIFGMMTTFGLYLVELQWENKLILVSHQLTEYEQLLQIPRTVFSPQGQGLLKKDIAALLIYGGSFTTWFCVATWFILPGLAIILAFFVLIVILVVQRQLRRFVQQQHPKAMENKALPHLT
jgi:hypothetical protein